MRFSQLVERRLQEAEASLGGISLPTTWDIGEWHHFKSPRGYGVTFVFDDHCHMRFARKMASAPGDRVDGVLKHEIGHVVDSLVPKKTLSAWSKKQGVKLASTPELRADDIAEAIWGEPLRYDELDVQSTNIGRVGRPKYLGV